MKAWQIYLIGISVLSFPVVMILYSSGYGTDQGLGYDIGSMLGQTSIIGGIVLGLYYLTKYLKREERKEKLKTPIS